MRPTIVLDPIMTKVMLCTIDQIEADNVIKVSLPNRAPLAVYNVSGKVYVTEDTCTHGQASLSEGEIADGQIICPYHGGTFDIATGEATGPPCIIPLKTYAPIIDGNAVYVEID